MGNKKNAVYVIWYFSQKYLLKMRPESLHHVVQYLHQDVSVLMFCDYYMFVHKMNKVDFEVLICFIISL
jgi:hypothetical protein